MSLVRRVWMRACGRLRTWTPCVGVEPRSPRRGWGAKRCPAMRLVRGPLSVRIRTLFFVAVDFDERVIRIREHVLLLGFGVQKRDAGTEVSQESGSCCFESFGVSENEGSREGTQGGGRLNAFEECIHGSVAQQGHIIEAVCAGEHSGDQRGNVQSCVGPLCR